MFNLFKFLLGNKQDRVKIFEGMDTPMPNFSMVATHVREGKKRPNYLLTDGEKLKSVVEKWEFKPSSDPISRCGHDYKIIFTNGDKTTLIYICFICNTLIIDGEETYKISKHVIKSLLKEDFTPL